MEFQYPKSTFFFGIDQDVLIPDNFIFENKPSGGTEAGYLRLKMPLAGIVREIPLIFP